MTEVYKDYKCRTCKKKKKELLPSFLVLALKNRQTLECSKCIRRNKKFICDYCGVLFLERRKLSAHIEIHIKNTCDACSAQFKTKQALRDHLRRHIEIQVCHHCGMKFQFSRFNYFKKHLATHDPSIVIKKKKRYGLEGTFKCKYCPMVYNKLTSLTSHERKVHPNGETEYCYKCKDCPMKFIFNEELRLHKFTHYTGKVYHCEHPDCGKFFNNIKLLRVHKFVHSGVKRFACEKCGQVNSIKNYISIARP